MNDHTLFVYGTLMRAADTPMHRLLARHGDYLGKGWLQGRLYEVAGYPGAIGSESAQEQVAGELFRLTAPELVLPKLDDYEGCGAAYPAPQEYRRERMPITLAQGGMVDAWVYLYNLAVDRLTPIPSGDYAAHLTATSGLDRPSAYPL